MKTNEYYEKDFIVTAKEKTGRSIQEWMDVLQPKGLVKQKEVLDWLKKDQQISHMNANFIAGIFLNKGKPVFDSKALFEAHFEEKEDKRMLYVAIESLVKKTFDTVQIVPTKGYISFRNKKEFAVAKINKTQIRVGLDLSGEPFTEYTQKAKSLGTMPRISHMVEVYNEDQVNDQLKEVLIKSNGIVNQILGKQKK